MVSDFACALRGGESRLIDVIRVTEIATRPPWHDRCVGNARHDPVLDREGGSREGAGIWGGKDLGARPLRTGQEKAAERQIHSSPDIRVIFRFNGHDVGVTLLEVGILNRCCFQGVSRVRMCIRNRGVLLP